MAKEAIVLYAFLFTSRLVRPNVFLGNSGYDRPTGLEQNSVVRKAYPCELHVCQSALYGNMAMWSGVYERKF